MIDNYEEAIALTQKMEAQLPIWVHPTPQLLKTIEEKGEKRYKTTDLFEIDSLFYAGDMGGITCTFKADPEGKVAISASLTHLRIPKDHPLALEIEAYQKRRVFRLALADAKKGKARRLAMKNRPKKGFGG